MLPSLHDDPYAAFQEWFALAEKTITKDPNAFCLSTATAKGRPSSRIVLLKGHDPEGYFFYTNYESRKSAELLENPFAAMNFYWPALDLQLRIEGRIEMASREESDAYFASRPRGSQISAITSKQSQPLESYTKFEELLSTTEAKFAGQDIPRPDNWGGWKLVPDAYEFWHQLEFRRHERVRFTRQDSGWVGSYLFP